MEPLFHRQFDVDELFRDYLLAPHSANKNWLWKTALEGSPLCGTMTVSKFAARPLPETIPELLYEFELREDAFTYEPELDTRFGWYANFADRQLFCAYRSSLFAQDEMVWGGAGHLATV